MKGENATCWSGQKGVVEDMGVKLGPGRLHRSEVRAAGGFSRCERMSVYLGDLSQVHTFGWNEGLEEGV